MSKCISNSFNGCVFLNGLGDIVKCRRDGKKSEIAPLVMVSYLSFMLTLRDHDSAAPSDLWIQLGAKRKQLLDRSWAGVFRDYLLLELPVGELAPHFSKDFGRPSKDLHVVLGALLLQQLHDLTDAQTVEAIAFNIA